MLRDVNDRAEDAVALADLLEARKAHVNLIPYNPVPGLTFERPTPASIDRFTATLRTRRISVSIRKTKGREIEAACGQLRRRFEENDPDPTETSSRRTPLRVASP
jgi:23S rRNA (adenine2503-C2)-methyltransferase